MLTSTLTRPLAALILAYIASGPLAEAIPVGTHSGHHHPHHVARDVRPRAGPHDHSCMLKGHPAICASMVLAEPQPKHRSTEAVALAQRGQYNSTSHGLDLAGALGERDVTYQPRRFDMDLISLSRRETNYKCGDGCIWRVLGHCWSCAPSLHLRALETDDVSAQARGQAQAHLTPTGIDLLKAMGGDATTSSQITKHRLPPRHNLASRSAAGDNVH